MHLRILTLFGLLFLSTFPLFGQDVEQCGSEDFLNLSVEHHPYLTEKRTAFLKSIESELPFQVRDRGISVIPVVVHIVYNTEEQNITDEQVHSQIAAINRDFRLRNDNVEFANANFKALASDASIEFCLADRNPNGNLTSGITRNYTPENQVGQKYLVGDSRRIIYYSELSGHDAWNPDEYLNIWVCEVGNNILGYSSFPEGAIKAEDGIVMDFRSFGSQGTAKYPNNLGKTLSHEIGHYLGLYHIWGNTLDDCDSDDGLEDTPPQENPTSGCPTSSQVSCSSFDMFNNYMDYAPDACMSIFTPDQVNMMLFTLNGVRSSLLNANNCSIDPVDDPLAEILIKGNPVTAKELILFSDKGSLFEVGISIYSTLGELVLAEKKYFFPAEQHIDIEFLPQGLYFIKMVTADTKLVKKVIISN